MRVTRQYDGAVQDIGFGSDGWISQSALLSFVTGQGSIPTAQASGSVSVWYDQTGNGYDLVQRGSFGLMPALVVAGVVQTFTSYPVLRMSSAQGSFLSTNGSWEFQVGYVSAVVEKDNDDTVWSLFGGYAWYGGNAYDGDASLLLDVDTCDPAVCGAGSVGTFNGQTYSPASQTPLPPLTLNAVSVKAANPLGNTWTNSIGLVGGSSSGGNNGGVLEFVVYSPNIVPSAADTAALTASQLSLIANSQFCFGLTDATACLTQLFAISNGALLRVPIPNTMYYISSVLVVPPYATFDGNGATFTLLQNPEHGWYDYMMCASTGSTILNLTLTAPYPSYGMCIESGATNVVIGDVRWYEVPGTAIFFGSNIAGVTIRDSSFVQVGYGILMDASFIQNVTVERCYFNNNTADAIALNAPILDSQMYSAFSRAWAVTGVAIINNTILNIRNDADESQGFCISSAGGQALLIQGNFLSGCSWQGIHLEDTTANVRILNNTIDNVYGNTSLAWKGALDGVWMEYAMSVLIQGNAFSRIPSSAVVVVGLPRLCYVDEYSPSYVLDGITVPWPYQVTNDINITGNTFHDWGSDGQTSSYALQLGNNAGEGDAIQRVWNNCKPDSTPHGYAQCV